MAGTVGALVG